MDLKGYIYASSMGEHKKCLDPTGPSTANGTVIQTWDCVDNYTMQQWVLNANNSISPKNDLNKCMTMTDDSAYNGASITLQPCDDSTRRKWYRYQLLRSGIGNGIAIIATRKSGIDISLYAL